MTTLRVLTLTAVLLGVVAIGDAQTVQVQAVKPEPAWCGGSWQPPMIQETVKDGKTIQTPIPGTGGTNYGTCVPIQRPVKGLDGKDTVVAIPTFPAHPATLVTFGPDPQSGALVGGRMMTTKDKDGKDVSKWTVIAPTVVKK